MLQERIVAAKALSEACAARGYATELHHELCRFPSAGFEVTVQDVQHAGQNQEVVFVLFSVGRPHSAFAPVQTICTSVAASLPQAAREASDQWLDLVFPVMHSVFADHETTLGVKIGELRSVLTATGQVFEWRVHMGPLFTRYFGDDGDKPEHKPTELLRHIVDALAGVSAHTEGFAVDLFVARDAQGRVTTDCRINNTPWQEASEALRVAPNSWPPSQATIVTKRQLLFFQPATPPALPSEPASQEPKRSLLKRLFGRRKASDA